MTALEDHLATLGRQLLDEVVPVTAHEAAARRTVDPVPPRRHRGVAAAAAAVVVLAGAGLYIRGRTDDAPTQANPPLEQTTAVTPAAPSAPTPTAVVADVDIAWPPRLLSAAAETAGFRLQSVNDLGTTSVERGVIRYERDEEHWVDVEYRSTPEILGDDVVALAGTVVGTLDLLGIPVDVEAFPDGFYEVRSSMPGGRGDSTGSSLPALGVSVRIGTGTLRVRSTSGVTLDEFVSIAEGLQNASPEAWDSALPDEAVAPSERPSVVDDLVGATPIPPGFDLDGWRTSAVIVMDPLAIGLPLGREIGCAWLDRFQSSVDDPNAANDALSGAREWSVWQWSRDDALFGLIDATLAGTALPPGADVCPP